MPPNRHGRRAFLATVGALSTAVAGCSNLLPAEPGDPSDVTTTGSSTGDGANGGDGSAGNDGRDVGDGTDQPSTPSGEPPSSVRLETLMEGFASPVGVEVAPNGDVFVVDQPGQVYLRADGTLRDDPVLDLAGRVVQISSFYDERGLLGLALHPDYADNGRLFVRYSAPRRDGTPSGYSHTFVLSEFAADPAAGTVDPSTERTVLEIPQPQSNHNAGSVVFGPDGYLYVGVGDGGGSHDTENGHVDDWYDRNDGGNGQDVTENLLGSVLRIDVDRDGEAADGDPYAVPDDNPLVGRDGLDEQWAWGFRNPWRLSFDRGAGGDDADLYVADVGQNAFEEVSVVRKGGNYGWNVREGAHCFDPESPTDPPAECPTETAAGEPLVQPVVEYPHGGAPVSGISVIGGYVYRGAAMPGLAARYVFADWQSRGRLFVATPAEEGLWATQVVEIANADDDRVGENVLSFGRDRDGEPLVTTTGGRGPSGGAGAVHRVTQAD